MLGVLNSLTHSRPIVTGIFRASSQCYLRSSQRITSGCYIDPMAAFTTGFSPRHFFSSGLPKLNEKNFFRPVLFQSDSNNYNFKIGRLKIWAGIGGLLLGAYLSEDHLDFTSYAFCAEGDRRGTSPTSRPIESSSRLGVVDRHQQNQYIDINDTEILGLQFDEIYSNRMSSSEEDRKFYMIEGSDAFRIEILNGNQLIWRSIHEVFPEDMEAAARFYEGCRRYVLVNTGIHGDEYGKASCNGEGIAHPGGFIVDDVNLFSPLSHVALHIVSSVSLPLTMQQLPGIDILDAWCWSEKTNDFTMGKGRIIGDIQWINDNSVPIKPLLEIAPIEIGYGSPITPNTDYVELDQLRQKICLALLDSSFCYLEGFGGMGKSRAALNLVEEIDKLITSKKYDSSISEINTIAQDCMTTVFISFKSKIYYEDFLRFVRKVVGSTESPKALLKEYFLKLGYTARAMSKQVLIILDNIDVDEDAEKLEMIVNLANQFKDENGKPIFKFLVTGRMRYQELNLTPKINTSQVIECYKHSPESMWNLFTTVFQKEVLKERGEEGKRRGSKYLQKNKKDLSDLIDNYGNNVGFTIIVAKMLSESFLYGEEDMMLGSINQSINAIIRVKGKLIGDPNDYGPLCEIFQCPLQYLDHKKRWDNLASQVYQVLALMSDGTVSHSSFRSVAGKINHSLKFPDITRFRKQLVTYGLFTPHPVDERLICMPPFYHRVMLQNLSDQYSTNYERRKVIDADMELILQKVKDDSSNLRQFTDENLQVLINLFNFVRKLSNAEQMYKKVGEAAAQYAARGLKTLKHDQVLKEYNQFLDEIPNMPGYSLDFVFCKYMKQRNIIDLPSYIIKKLTECTAHQNPDKNEIVRLARSLNNVKVFVDENSLNPDELNILNDKLSELTVSPFLDEETKKAIKANLDQEKRGELLAFPEITFHDVSFDQRQKVITWKKDNKDNPDLVRDKIANLKNTKIVGGLSELIHYLMEEIEVVEVDVSHNSLGRQDSKELSALCDLLKYPGTLKRLHLNNNSLNRMDKAGFATLLQALASNTTLEFLHLNNNSLNDEKIEKLCEALKNHPTIKEVYLDSNCFSNVGLGYLIRLMGNNKEILKINTAYAHSWWWRHRGVNGLVRRWRDIIAQYDGEEKIIIVIDNASIVEYALPKRTSREF